MKPMHLTFSTWFAVVALGACGKTVTDDNSSGSNWLTCQTLDDCRDQRAVQCSQQGYCLDSHGERIPFAAVDASSASVHTADASSPSVHAFDSSPPPVHTVDASSPPAPPGDAGSTPRVVDARGPADAGALRWKSACEEPGARGPLTARPGETCYTFALHGASSPTDTSAFSVSPGESFNQVYYAAPWPSGTVATSYGVVGSPGSPALRAWLFATSSNTLPGTVFPNVTGTLLGENARLLGAWAVGGCNVVLPDSIGLELPSSGVLVVQWHHENDGGSAVDDTSAFRVCTAPASSRAERAAYTWLGTEDFHGTGAPVGTSSFGGSCANESGAPVTIVSIDPYMHRIGAGMTTVIERAAGGALTVLDSPFRFADQQSYTLVPPPVIEPGDSVRTTCTYDNATGSTVPFGQSSHQEMCFAFALTYPPGALDNGVISLVGATNTCW